MDLGSICLVGGEIYLASVALNLIHKGINNWPNESVKIRTQTEPYYDMSSKPRSKYGIIIADSPRIRLKKDFANAAALSYNAFISLGYESKNIFVLEGNKNPAARFEAVNLAASRKNLIDVIDFLSKKITPEDEFFMSVFAHGEPTVDLPFFSYTGQSKILLSSKSKDSINETDLERMLSKLNPKYSILFFNSCFGGGFAKRLGVEKTIAISLSRSDKVSSASTSPSLKEKYGPSGSTFTLVFFSALRGCFSDGVPIELPSRDLCSIFDYAAKMEKQDYSDIFTNSSFIMRMYDNYCKKNGIESADYFLTRLKNHFEKFSSFGRNTPHMIYGRINPAELRLGR